MEPKTYLLSFLMMDIYARSVLVGSPAMQTTQELERAMDFVEQAESLMKKRGWLLNAKVRNIESSAEHAKAYPGLRDFVLSQSPTEHPLPTSDATGAA